MISPPSQTVLLFGMLNLSSVGTIILTFFFFLSSSFPLYVMSFLFSLMRSITALSLLRRGLQVSRALYLFFFSASPAPLFSTFPLFVKA